jgi:hypothetical protein
MMPADYRLGICRGCLALSLKSRDAASNAALYEYQYLFWLGGIHVNSRTQIAKVTRDAACGSHTENFPVPRCHRRQKQDAGKKISSMVA